MSDIHSPEYRPSNVRVVEASTISDRWVTSSTKFIVLDFDGTPIQGFSNRADAEARARVRAGVIRAALTRRANKARREAR